MTKPNGRSYVRRHCNKWPFKRSRTSACLWVPLLDEADSSLIARTTNMTSLSGSWGISPARKGTDNKPHGDDLYNRVNGIVSDEDGLATEGGLPLLRLYTGWNLEMPRFAREVLCTFTEKLHRPSDRLFADPRLGSHE
jgi:hypothetical protein